MGRIIVGVDGSEGAAHALRWAHAEGARRHWSVTAVLAWGYLDQHHAVATEGFDPEYTAADAERALDSYLQDALGADSAGAVHRHVVSDLAPRALLTAATAADLLVVGARGLGGFRGLLLGSVSRRALHEAPCAIAVIRPDVTEAPEPHVVVGIDGSPSSHRALAWAVEEARARDAVLEIVHAWQPPYVGGYPFVPASVDLGVFEEGAQKVMSDAIASVDVADLGDRIRETVVCSGPAGALLEAATHASVVVVGARGVGRIERFFLGSVSDQVAQHAAAPVVVVHDTVHA